MTNSETNYYSQGLDFLLKNSYKQGVSDVLDKIRAEINGMYRVILKDTPKDDWAVRWNDCIDDVLQIIDKYLTEGSDKQ